MKAGDARKIKLRMMKIKEKNVQDWYDKDHDTPKLASRQAATSTGLH